MRKALPQSPHGEGAVEVGVIERDESSWMRLKLNWPRLDASLTRLSPRGSFGLGAAREVPIH